jgi:CRISPR type I-E-associated protein CasB/Cse2
MGTKKLDRKISELMTFLYSQKELRGVMADLKRGFNEDTQSRAWAHIAQFCDLRNNRERVIVQLISAGFATCKESGEIGNLGGSMRKIATGDGKGMDGLATYEARFRRLLSASSTEELCDFLPGIIKTANVKGVGINFYQLYKDLTYWGECTKIEWAAEYWGRKKQTDDRGGDDIEVFD